MITSTAQLQAVLAADDLDTQVHFCGWCRRAFLYTSADMTAVQFVPHLEESASTGICPACLAEQMSKI